MGNGNSDDRDNSGQSLYRPRKEEMYVVNRASSAFLFFFGDDLSATSMFIVCALSTAVVVLLAFAAALTGAPPTGFSPSTFSLKN